MNGDLESIFLRKESLYSCSMCAKFSSLCKIIFLFFLHFVFSFMGHLFMEDPISSWKSWKRFENEALRLYQWGNVSRHTLTPWKRFKIHHREEVLVGILYCNKLISISAIKISYCSQVSNSRISKSPWILTFYCFVGRMVGHFGTLLQTWPN